MYLWRGFVLQRNLEHAGGGINERFMPRRIPGSALEALASRAGRCVKAPGALEGGCGGEGRGAADSKGNLGLHVGAFSLSFFSIVLKTSRIDSLSDFGPVLGPELEAFSYFSLSQDGVLH